ncbi:MAG: hypothetical protein U9P44_03660 [archaeon]|nr:hypothetical protein [archaeon]
MKKSKAAGIEKKGISPLLAGVIFTAIIITTTSLVMSGIIPSLNNIRDTVVVDSAQKSMNYLNEYIEIVAQEGEYSQRVLPFSIRKGTISIVSANTTRGDTGRIFFEIDTKSLAVSPRTSKKIGDLTFSSNTNASAYANATDITMENEHLKIYIKKAGNSSDPVSIDISDLLKNIYFKDDSKLLFEGTDSFSIQLQGLPQTATGYVELKDSGSELGKAEAVAYMTSSSTDYEIHFILESGTDYLKVKVTSSQYFEWVEANMTSAYFVRASSDYDTSKNFVESSTLGTVLAFVTENDAVMSYEASSHKLYLSQPFKSNKLYIVFTRGEKGTIRQRIQYINDKTFETLYSPNFGFKIEKDNKIRLTLGYGSVNIYADESQEEITQRLQAGNYQLLVKNMGVSAGNADILVKLL